MSEPAYIEVQRVVTDKKWNPKYDQLAKCICGHHYERHFDSYDQMENVGCKYCGCREFICSALK
jgi:hypothetical protein